MSISLTFSERREFSVYTATDRKLTVYCGDVLKFLPSVAGQFDAIWDRSAIIAINVECAAGQRQNQVTIGNYFKHLMMYDDNRFAKHPRWRFFALNTEMRWRALQTGRVYVKQHPGDAQLSLDELRDMVGREGQTFSNRVSTVS